MLLQIQGYHLPGRVWQTRNGHYENVHVGIQDGNEPRELVRGDAEKSLWTVPIEVVAREADLEPVVAGAGDTGQVTARVDLTDECGGPRCARLSPPALRIERAAD